MSLSSIDTISVKDEDESQEVSEARMREIARRSHSSNDFAEEQEEEKLVDRSDLLNSDRGAKEKKSFFIRTLAALTIGAVALLAVFFVFSFVGKITGRGNVASEKESIPFSESPEEEASRNASLQTELALGDQAEDMEVELVKEEEPAPVEEPVSEVKTSPAPQPAPVSQTVQVEEVEELDPLDEWSRLSTLGTSVGDRDLAVANLNDESNSSAISSSAAPPVSASRSASRAATPVFSSRSTSTAPSPPASSVTSDRYAADSPTAQRVEQNELDERITKGEVGQVASVSIGKSSLDTEESSAKTTFDENYPAVQNILSDSRDSNSYLNKKKKQYEEEDRLKYLSDLGTATATSTNTDQSDQNYVATNASYSRPNSNLTSQRTQTEDSRSFKPSISSLANNSVEAPQSVTPEPTSKDIPLGSTAKGEVSTSIIWSEGVSSDRTRATINLEEDLLSDDGSVALEANSSLVAEVKSIQNGGFTILDAIAVSYEDSSGKLVQQSIPPGSILIKGKDGSALIAEKTNDPGGTVLGQDVLIGLLGAGEQGFKNINQPSNRTVVSNDDFFQSTVDRDSSLVNGAAEGVFSTTKERLEDRSEDIVESELDRIPVYQIKTGTKVSIFVNSFLEINK